MATRTRYSNNTQKWVIEWLRQEIKRADLGPGGNIVVHQHVPPPLERWIKRDAKRRGYHVSFFGNPPTVSIITKAMRVAADEERKRQTQVYENWINSPG